MKQKILPLFERQDIESTILRYTATGALMAGWGS